MDESKTLKGKQKTAEREKHGVEVYQNLLFNKYRRGKTWQKLGLVMNLEGKNFKFLPKSYTK